MSAYRACVGGYVGGGHVHPALLDAARERLAAAKESGAVADGYVARCGDDIDLMLLHDGRSCDARSIARDVFGAAASAGSRLRQHGNGGVEIDGVELSLAPRPSEPVLFFFSNRSVRGAWSLLAYRMLADPFVTPGLVGDAAMREGFRFTVRDPDGSYDLPADLYRFLAAVGRGARTVEVRSRTTDEIAAVVSGGTDPVLVVRCESPFPGVEDALEAFSVEGSSMGLAPVSANADSTTRSIPRAIGLGFQVTPERLVGPRDLLGDAAFEEQRREAVAAARRTRNGAAIQPREVPAAI
ncbi:MAG TPA: fructose 1,6-bisphosphatase [Actinomycetota bacterium]|jgi:fructose 1,6-bisphosphate aldolase/phosphatase|nr:fructose 1,6-bisphosphatase [Actinomycetota bacterium]